MTQKKFNFEVVEGVTEGISYTGKRQRRRTVLLKLGNHSISLKAFKLGLILGVFQILDGLLTYVGLNLMGVGMEGNAFLRSLVHAYGSFLALFVTKTVALALVITLTLFAHKRKWIRPIIFVLCLIYLTLAVMPWVYIISTEKF